MRFIESSSLGNQSLVTALLCHQYTADDEREIYFCLYADQVAGNGTYTTYVTKQRQGAGAFYEVQPRTAPSVASGVTNIAFTTIAVPVRSGDVVRVYLLGLAGDTTTPDIVTEVFEADYARPTTPGQHFIDIDASGGVEVGAFQTGVIDADALDASFSTELILALLASAITGGTVEDALETVLARLDATITSRAATGAAMDLVTGALDAAALDPSASAELILALLATLITGGTVQEALENALNAAVPGDAMDLILDALDANAVAPSGAAEIAAAVGGDLTIGDEALDQIAQAVCARCGGSTSSGGSADCTDCDGLGGGVSSGGWTQPEQVP